MEEAKTDYSDLIHKLQLHCDLLRASGIAVLLQEAIDAIHRLSATADHYKHTGDYWYQMCIDLNRKPDSGPKWRNASDEEPTFGEDVIVWIHDDTGDTPFDYTSVGWLTSHRDWIVDNEECRQVWAWQPKPKPGDED